MRTHHISLNKAPQGYQFSLEPKMVDIVDLLKDQKAANILDVGCGTGRHSRFLAKHAFSVYALDFSQKALVSLTKSIYRSQSKSLSPLRAHFTALPFQTACMDAILCFSTIHHGFHREIVQALQEFARVLHPGGFLFLDILSQNDPSYGIGTSIEPHTFVGGRSGEENIPHHYVSQNGNCQFVVSL